MVWTYPTSGARSVGGRFVFQFGAVGTNAALIIPVRVFDGHMLSFLSGIYGHRPPKARLCLRRSSLEDWHTVTKLTGA